MSVFWVICIFLFGFFLGFSAANYVWTRAAKTGDCLRGFDDSLYIVKEI